MANQFTYTKAEKLKSKKELDNLFAKGKTLLVHPLKIFYFFKDCADENNIRCGVGVSKKHFAKAVDRNRIKRLLREAFRLNKFILKETIHQKQLSFFVLYIDKTLPINFDFINEKMKKAMANILKKYDNELDS